jgi:hypothetical protein
MQGCCTCGSVRGALGNRRPYRDTSSSPNSFVSLQTEGTYSPARTATRNWETRSKCSFFRTLPVLHAAILSHRYS